AVDVEPQFTFGIFSRKINFARWRIDSFSHNHEMVDELLHFRHDVGFWRQHVFPIGHIDRSDRKFIDDLAKDEHALTHLFDPDQITIVAITRGTNDYLEVILVVIKIRMGASEVVLDPASTQVRSGNGIGYGSVFWNDPNIAGAIDKDSVPREQAIDFVQLRD